MKSELISDAHDSSKKRKVTIERSEVEADEHVKRSNRTLTDVGRMYQDKTQWEYIGSAAVHYLKHRERPDTHTVATQVAFGKNMNKHMNEGLADFGWKELRKTIMKLFGREENKK